MNGGRLEVFYPYVAKSYGFCISHCGQQAWLYMEKKCNRPPFTEVRKAKNIGIKAFQVIEMYYQSLKKVQYLRNTMKAGHLLSSSSDPSVAQKQRDMAKALVGGAFLSASNRVLFDRMASLDILDAEDVDKIGLLSLNMLCMMRRTY
ncbi:hypothetical protein QUC31_006365 [Theobroma cacao]